MTYKVVQSKTAPDEWIVEAIDFDSEGEIYAATFSGPMAESRAGEYAAWQNSKSSNRESQLSRTTSAARDQ
jgi:hypothetical protein